MRAVVADTGGLRVAEVDQPVPGPGHVLVRTVACGICGSDLHAAADLGRFAAMATELSPTPLDPHKGVVLGHEFCAEVLEVGPGGGAVVPGSLVCSVPILFGPAGVESIGYSDRFPGGLGEYMVLQEQLLLTVPEGLGPEVAALTEPLAVGEHAVNLAGLRPGDPCLVVGCGPVGLAVVAALRARGHGPVLAADFSPTRRRLAEAMGADEVVDPAVTSPHTRWADLGVPTGVFERTAAELFGTAVPDAVIFEAVGVPGVLQSLVAGAPPRARIVVVGVCMATDHLEPFQAVTKQLELRFSFGYSGTEFADTLARLGRGELAVDGLVTHRIGLDDVPRTFAELAHPGEHGKVLIRHGGTDD